MRGLRETWSKGSAMSDSVLAPLVQTRLMPSARSLFTKALPPLRKGS